MRRVKLVDNLREVLDAVSVKDALLVGCAVFRQFVVDIEEINRYLVTLLTEHPGYCQRITAIVSGTGKDNHGLLTVPFRGDGSRQCFGCAFHQIYGADRLVLHGVMVEFVYLIAGKNLHLGTKIQK